MDNKTKVKVAVVIGIVILAVVFIFMVVFVKGNNSPKTNKNIPTREPGTYSSSSGNTSNSNSNSSTNSTGKSDNKTGKAITLDEIVSLAIKDNCLVKIDSNLKSTIVKELEDEYISFCYGDSKAYIATNQDDSCVVSEIDLLKSNYPTKEIFSTNDYSSINDLDYYAGKLYFVTENNALVEYSIEEDFSRFLTNENEVSHFAIDKNKNLLYASYMPNGENCGIYVLDFTANTFSQIVGLEELSGELVLNNSSLIIDVKEYGKLFVYNSETNTILDIGDCNLGKTSSHVAFYSNNLLYTDGNKIDIKDESGNSSQDEWYYLGDNSISRISMITPTKLELVRNDENGKSIGIIIIDLTDGSAVEEPDIVYSEVILIK